MERYHLRLKGFINPFWMNRNLGNPIDAVVSDGKVEADGVTLTLDYSDGQTPLADGTEVECYIAAYFYCHTKADVKASEEQRVIRRQEQQQSYEARLNQYRDEANAFNATLALPFSWKAGFKAVLSGLTEKSSGNGINRATVMHVELTEDFKQGRLDRKAGDFLCSKDKGMEYVDSEATAFDGEGKAYQPKITCKACLKRAEKYLRQTEVQK